MINALEERMKKSIAALKSELATVPQTHSRLFVPRAAFSHSNSVGNRPPAHSQYAFASSQFTQATFLSSFGSHIDAAAGIEYDIPVHRHAIRRRVIPVGNQDVASYVDRSNSC